MFNSKLIRDHLPFINDVSRNSFYREQINLYCKNKIVVDVGAGTGILTDYALDSGAKKIYCVEIKKHVAKFLQEKYKFNHKVTVLEGDFMDMIIPDAEVFILEQTGWQFSNDFLTKKFMTTINHATIIPNKIKLKAYIFDGIVDESPNFLIDSAVLPKGYYDHCMTQAINKPVETIDVYEINHRNAKDKIKFTLNLTGYKQCTIFIEN